MPNRFLSVRLDDINLHGGDHPYIKLGTAELIRKQEAEEFPCSGEEGSFEENVGRNAEFKVAVALIGPAPDVEYEKLRLAEGEYVPCSFHPNDPLGTFEAASVASPVKCFLVNTNSWPNDGGEVNKGRRLDHTMMVQGSVQHFTSLVITDTPVDLAATGGTGEVVLDWTALDTGPAEKLLNPNYTRASGINVYRGTTTGVYGVAPVNPAPLPIGDVTYTDTVAAGAYFYVIQYVDDWIGASAISNEATGTSV